jgi:hypothetical protein
MTTLRRIPLRIAKTLHRLAGTDTHATALLPRRRQHHVGRVSRDEDFSGETGAERRWKHRHCCSGARVHHS